MTPHVFHDLVNAVKSGQLDESTMAQLVDVARSVKLSKQFIDALLGDSRTPGGLSYDIVNGVNELLEKVAIQDEEIGCLLMLELLAVAIHTEYHDVCDSIHFWIWESASEAVRTRICNLASSHQDTEFRCYLMRFATKPGPSTSN